MTDIQIVHALPNRVRLKMRAVKNSRTARQVQERAKGVDGIYWVRANAKCAGIVVRFDGTRFSKADIVDLMQQFTVEGHA